MKLAVVLAALLSTVGVGQEQPAGSPKSKTVTIVGPVMKPGTYAFKDRLTVLQLIARAGGPDRKADLSTVQIVRVRKTAVNSTEPETIKVDVSAINKLKQ